MEIIRHCTEAGWKRFLATCANATIWHTPEWKTFLERTFDYVPCYLFVQDDCGDVIGLLPLFQVRSRLTGNRFCAAPFAPVCAPLGTAGAVQLLLEEAVRDFHESAARFMEIRDYTPIDNFHCRSEFHTFWLDLSPALEEIWARFGRDVRRGITKSKNAGVRVSTTRDREDLKAYYDLNCITKRKLGVPAHPWEFFRNLFDSFGQDSCLYVARYRGEPIGGMVVQFFRDIAYAGYSGSNPQYYRLFTDNAINWKIIEDVHRRGYRRYDLGRANVNSKGLINFKRRWKALEKKTCYNYYPHYRPSMANNRDNIRYRLTTGVVRRMPMPLYRGFSRAVFGSLG